jgi:hypothetical protein
MDTKSDTGTTGGTTGLDGVNDGIAFPSNAIAVSRFLENLNGVRDPVATPDDPERDSPLFTLASEPTVKYKSYQLESEPPVDVKIETVTIQLTSRKTGPAVYKVCIQTAQKTRQETVRFDDALFKVIDFFTKTEKVFPKTTDVITVLKHVAPYVFQPPPAVVYPAFPTSNIQASTGGSATPIGMFNDLGFKKRL